MVLVIDSLPICILQFIHAMCASLLIILFPILIYWLVSLDFPIIIAVHPRVDILLGVEIAILLFGNARLNNIIIICSMSTRSGSVATIVFQNQVLVKLKVVNMNLLLK